MHAKDFHDLRDPYPKKFGVFRVSHYINYPAFLFSFEKLKKKKKFTDEVFLKSRQKKIY